MESGKKNISMKEKQEHQTIFSHNVWNLCVKEEETLDCHFTCNHMNSHSPTHNIQKSYDHGYCKTRTITKKNTVTWMSPSLSFYQEMFTYYVCIVRC